MISNYSPPQHQILLRLQETQSGSAPRMAALVIGNQFLLNRYGYENVPAAAFAAQLANQTLAFQYRNSAGSVVALDTDDYAADLDSVKLYGVGLEASLATIDGATAPAVQRLFVESLGVPNVLRMGTTGSHSNVKGSSLAALLVGRPVTVGDLCYVTFGGTTRRRTVTGLKGVAIASSFGANTVANDSLAGNAAVNPPTVAADALTVVSAPVGWGATIDSGEFAGTLEGASYLGQHGDLFTLTVTTGGLPGVAEVALTSASGLFSDSSIVTANEAGNFNIAGVAGMVIQLAPPGGTTTLTAGQVFQFSVVGAYTRLSSTSSRLVLGGTYSGAKNTSLVLKVVTGTTGDTATGAVLEISDTSGLLTVSQVTLTNGVAAALGLGLTATFDLNTTPAPQAGLRKGDIYVIHALAATESTTDFDRVVLDGAAVDLSSYNDPTDPVTVEFRKAFTGIIAADDAADDEAWTVDALTGVTLQSGAALYVADRTAGSQWVPFVDAVGELALSYRALKKAGASDTYVTVSSEAEIVEKLGVIDAANELAKGAERAFAGSGGQTIYALNIGGKTAADLTAALRKLESNDAFSFLALVSDASTAAITQQWKESLRTHCSSMSGPTKRNFRKCYVGTELPGRFQALGLNPDTQLNYTATISDAGGGEYRLVTHTHPTLDFRNLLLSEGDVFVSKVTGAEYLIDSVVSANELLLQSGPIAAVPVAEAFELLFEDTNASQVRFIQETNAALSSEYCTNVVIPGVGYSAGVAVPARFLAAELTGARAAMPAQTGMTNLEVTGVTSIPAAYTRWEEQELNDMAASGTLLIMQTAPGAACFVRHQLTTETSKGDLYFEDNALAVLFRIGFYIKDAFSGVIGRKNATRRQLSIMEGSIIDVCSEQSRDTDLDDVNGPLIQGYRDVSVRKDPTFTNVIRQRVVVGIALPIGTIYTEILGEIATA